MTKQVAPLPAVRQSGTEPQAASQEITVGRREIHPLSQAAMLEESGGPRLMRAATWTMVGLIFALTGWSAVARIDEVAVAFGQVLPAGRIQQVQHLEGGIVSDILVDDGDHVTAGQPLIALEAAGTAPDYSQMRNRLTALQLQAERLRAFASGREPTFPEADRKLAWMVEDQRTLYEITERARQNQLAVLDEQLAQQEAQLEALNAQESTFLAQSPLIEEEAVMRRDLFDKGLASKVGLLSSERELAQVQGEIARIQPLKAEVMSSITETKSRRIELDTRLRQEALDELAEVSKEVVQVSEAIEKSRDRTDRLVIRSPVDGIIKGLMVSTIGGVVKAGDTILEVVPTGDELELEVQIATQDIGYVEPGLPVTVKLTAFDFARFGTVAGELIRVSATTFQDADGRPYYRGNIRLQADHVGADPAANRIIPGMTAVAEIKTGDRTIMDYMLKPVRRAFDEGLRER